jgi:hypothetical protein
MLLFLNYGVLNNAIKKHIPALLAFGLSLIIIFLSITVIWIALKFLQRKALLKRIVFVSLVTLCGLFLINTVSVAGKLFSKIKTSLSTKAPQEIAIIESNRNDSLESIEIPVESSLAEYMPNIYYFVLDEYASFDVIEKYYKYDNSEFHDFLLDSGFNVSNTSQSLATQTQICMADVLSLDYLSSENRNLSYARKALNNAKLYKELGNLAYSLYQMSTGVYVFRGIPSLRDESEFVTGEPETEDGTTVTEIARDQSILSIFSPGYLVLNLKTSLPRNLIIYSCFLARRSWIWQVMAIQDLLRTVYQYSTILIMRRHMLMRIRL